MSELKAAEMNYYMVYFDFTTAHRNSMFRGRSGQLEVESELPLNDWKKHEDELIQLCAKFVHSKKPKWNIFMLDIKKVEPIKISTPNERG